MFIYFGPENFIRVRFLFTVVRSSKNVFRLLDDSYQRNSVYIFVFCIAVMYFLISIVVHYMCSETYPYGKGNFLDVNFRISPD